MPLALDGTLHHDVNIARASVTVEELMYRHLQVRKAAGEVVVGSSDGTTFGASDLITSAAAWNNNAYVIIRNADSTVWECWQRGTSSTAWRAKVARSAFAAPSHATQTPAATGEEYLLGGGTDASPTFTTFFATGYYHLTADEQPVNGHTYWGINQVTVTGSPSNGASICRTPVVAHASDDTAPVAWVMNLTGSIVVRTWDRTGAWVSTGTLVAEVPAATDVSTPQMMRPANLRLSSTSHKGLASHIPVYPNMSATQKYPAALNDAALGLRWVHGMLLGGGTQSLPAFPFPTNVNPLDDNTANSNVAVTYLRGYTPDALPSPPPDTTPPTITNLTPPPGAAISDATETVEFDVLDPDGVGIAAVFARFIAQDDYDVVWDGASFAPRYQGSTVEAVEEGLHFVLKSQRGWAALGPVRFRALAVDPLGNVEA